MSCNVLGNVLGKVFQINAGGCWLAVRVGQYSSTMTNEPLPLDDIDDVSWGIY